MGRRLLRAELRHEREIRRIVDKHERQMRQLSERAVEQARSIQSVEYARRLEDLNHAHELERQRNAESVTRVEFALFKDDLEKRTALADRELRAKLEGIGNDAGGLHEASAVALAREEASRVVVESQTANRRWLIGLLVAIALGVLAQGIVLIRTFVTGG